MAEIRFDGRVAVVTGAARGIGFAHADLLARRGAQVLINDLGNSVHGTGRDRRAADEAVARIRAVGGTAEANYDDVASDAGAAALAGQAMDVFGRIDIVVNNAGNFATDAFPDVNLADLNALLAVHVGGAFNVTKECWPHMERAGYGRVVITTSTGALGAANITAYAAAKGAALGLGRSLAAVGRPLGILVNLLAPTALTRMTTVTAAERPEPRDPALVSPRVALLCHESCAVSGEIFTSGMRRYARIFLAECEGYSHAGLEVTPEDVAENWELIMDPAAHHITPDLLTWRRAHSQRILPVAGQP